MASCLHLNIFWTLLISFFVVFECSKTIKYDVVGRDGLRSSTDELVFVFKRDAPVNNNIKTKVTDGKNGVQKLDKNSAASPVAETASSSVKKTLPPLLDQPKTLEELPDDDIIKDFINATELKPEEKPNIHHDAHQYYNSTVVTEQDKINMYWVDLTKMGESVITHDMLSKSYRRAATVSLTFDFPFYGHILKNATIATGGFLYLGDYMHSWLASTQYIAPLMANFDTSLSDKSVIKYADNGTDFVVQWEAAYLQDHQLAGPFTFQARLRHNGDIVFAYKQIPVTITSIPDGEHPVRVGISDAYIIDKTVILLKRKIIYEYHRVEIGKERIANLTAVYLTALPSCITLRDCESCQRADIGFHCTWCDKVNRCSDGMDRYRHDWLIKGCDISKQAEFRCPVTKPSIEQLSDDQSGFLVNSFSSPSSPTSNFTLPNNSFLSNSVSVTENDSYIGNDTLLLNSQLQNLHMNLHSGFYHNIERSFGAAGIIGILFVVAMLFGFVSWLIYAYKYPHSPSGQMIIKYRPSQWHWNRGEANYTPASVHI